MSTISGNMNTLTVNIISNAPKEALQKAMSARVVSAQEAAKIETSKQSGGISKTMYASIATTVKAVHSKISADGKTSANTAFSAESLMKNIPGLSKERAEEISKKLNKQLQDSITGNLAEKPKSKRESQEMRLRDMFDIGMLKTAASRIAKAVGAMDSVAHARMGELASEYQALQAKMVATARDIVKQGEPKTKGDNAKAQENQQKLFDLISKSENKRTEALKTLSEFFKYGPQEKQSLDNWYGDFGGKNTAFTDKVKEIANGLKAKA